MSVPQNQIANFQNQINSIKITASSRFAAAHRLRSLNFAFTLITALASILLIGLSLSAAIFTIEGTDSKFNNLYSILAAIVVLVLSLIQNAGDYSRRASRFEACALKINCIKQKMETVLDDNRTSEVLLRFVDEYNQILAEHGENHQPIDYKYFCLQYNGRYGIQLTWWKVLWYRIVIFVNKIAVYGILFVFVFPPIAYVIWPKLL